MSRLLELAQDLPDGPMWMTGRFLKTLLKTLDADRVRLMPTSGNEIPTDRGRFFDIQAGDGTARHPLELVAAGTGTYRIVYGTVAGLSTPFSPGDSPIYTLSVGNGNKVYANLAMSYDADTGVWTATGLTFEAAASVPEDSDTNAYFEIGSVSSSGAPASAVNGSVAHKRCGDDENFTDYFYG